MLKSACICQKNKTLFKKIIEYKNETVFKDFEGIVIGQCKNCGVLKTVSAGKTNFDPKQSRFHLYEEKRDLFIPLFQPIVKKIKQYKKSGTILDVGCSSGLLLELLEKEGFDVFGMEPNKAAYFAARGKFGKKIFFGTLAKYNHKKFDIVIYNHVLEHIDDINKEFSFVKKILKKDGLLVIGAPNIDNIIFKLRQKYWEPLMPKEHLWYFSKRYLTDFLQKNGFKILDISFSDDKRQDYPPLKQIYFRMLSLVNKLMSTGETMLIIAQLKYE